MTLKIKFVSKKVNYFPSLITTIKKSRKKVCYVSYNRSCESLREIFEKKKIKDYFIIDCITSAMKSISKKEKCEFFSHPNELKEISNGIKKAIKQDCNLIIFDSLSNLVRYNLPGGANILKDFIESFAQNLKKSKGKAIFICFKDDKKKFLIEEALPLFKK